MTMISLDAQADDRLLRMLNPRSIAIVGATDRMPSIGGYVTSNIARSFKGEVLPINPRSPTVQNLKAYPSVDAMPADVDLVMVVIPAEGVAPILESCAAKNVGGAVVITSGFAEVGEAGAKLQDEIAAIARRTGLRVIGPNCIGFMNSHRDVMANFVLDPGDSIPPPGPVALVSQSGGFGGYMVRKALTAGLNVGWFVSTGNEADVNIATVLRTLVEAPEVRTLLAFSETLRDPDRFMAFAQRAAELDKPVVILKAGRSNEAARAAQAHTASLVGSAQAFDAVCRQYGVFSVSSLEEMLDLGLIFQGGRRARGNRVSIITGSGGAGVMLTDACALEGLAVPVLPREDQEALLERMPKPFYGSVANPVDVTAQALANPATMPAVLKAVADSKGGDMLAPVIIGNPNGQQMYIDFFRGTDKPVAITSTLLGADLLAAGVPTFTDPRRAAHALAALADFSQRSRRPIATADWKPDPKRAAAARAIVAEGEGRSCLLESTAKTLLSLYGVVAPRETFVRGVEEAVRAAEEIGGKVVLKIMSYDLPHKSDVGGVRLAIQGPDAMRDAYAGMMDDVRKLAPQARIEGALVQAMVPARLEMLCGMKRDPVFGPIVAIGLGGVLVEILGSAALLRAPFDGDAVVVALQGLLGGRLLGGTRGLTPAEVQELARLAVALGDIALELPEISSAEINPIRVAAGAAIAADALITLD
ncbi:MAG: acetate--CoA ligase family protein [Rhizomicrobium sp.]